MRQFQLPGFELLDLLPQQVPIAFMNGAMLLELLQFLALAPIKIFALRFDSLKLGLQCVAVGFKLMALGLDVFAETVHLGEQFSTTNRELFGVGAELFFLFAKSCRFALEMLSRLVDLLLFGSNL